MPQGTITHGLRGRNIVKQKEYSQKVAKLLGLFNDIFDFSKGTRFLKAFKLLKI